MGRHEDLPDVLTPECVGVDIVVVSVETEFSVQYNEAFFRELFKVESFASANKFSVEELALYQLETLA
jgi:hypothetical protein